MEVLGKKEFCSTCNWYQFLMAVLMLILELFCSNITKQQINIDKTWINSYNRIKRRIPLRSLTSFF